MTTKTRKERIEYLARSLEIVKASGNSETIAQVLFVESLKIIRELESDLEIAKDALMKIQNVTHPDLQSPTWEQCAKAHEKCASEALSKLNFN